MKAIARLLVLLFLVTSYGYATAVVTSCTKGEVEDLQESAAQPGEEGAFARFVLCALFFFSGDPDYGLIGGSEGRLFMTRDGASTFTDDSDKRRRHRPSASRRVLRPNVPCVSTGRRAGLPVAFAGDNKASRPPSAAAVSRTLRKGATW